MTHYHQCSSTPYAITYDMFTIHKHDYTEVKRQRRRNRDVIREDKLKQFGIEPLVVPDREPLPEEVRQERIALLSYEQSKARLGLTDEQIQENQRLRRKRQNDSATLRRPKGSERTERQYINRKIINIKGKCRKEGVPCNITVDDFTVPEFCPVLGIKMEWSGDLRDGTPSFDRFDPDAGYVKGNVNVISLKANRLKSNATIDDLKAIVAWMEAMTPSSSTAP